MLLHVDENVTTLEGPRGRPLLDFNLFLDPCLAMRRLYSVASGSSRGPLKQLYAHPSGVRDRLRGCRAFGLVVNVAISGASAPERRPADVDKPFPAIRTAHHRHIALSALSKS